MNLIQIKNGGDYMTLCDEFVKNVQSEVENNSMYVWGGQGELMETLSPKQLERMETSKKNVQRILIHLSEVYNSESGLKNVRVFDCSGLITYHLMKLGILRSDTTANGLYKWCKPITKKELRAGDLVFKVSEGKAVHVALFAGDHLVEAVGRDEGVKNTELTTKFNKYGRIPAFV